MKKKTLFISLAIIVPMLVIGLGITFLVNYHQSQFAFQGPSMLPTLHDGQLIHIEKYSTNSTPQRGDVVVYNNPKYQSGDPGSPQRLVHRVIGVPGDRVIIKDSSVTIIDADNPNGLNPDTGFDITQPTKPDGYTTLKNNQYFLLGDNRPNAFDSRYVGVVEVDSIEGKVILSR